MCIVTQNKGLIHPSIHNCANEGKKCENECCLPTSSFEQAENKLQFLYENVLSLFCNYSLNFFDTIERFLSIFCCLKCKMYNKVHFNERHYECTRECKLYGWMVAMVNTIGIKKVLTHTFYVHRNC